MDIPYSKLGLNETEFVDILNVKVKDYETKNLLTQRDGIFKRYHIAKGNWISILLDGTIKLDEILNFVDESYKIIDNYK